MRRAIILFTALIASLAVPAAAQERKTPYWASISAGEALMRTGPGRNYPGMWLYRRADLPIKVLEVYPNWRKVQDPDGAVGWMLVNLLSDTRTAIVRGTEPQALHEEANASSAIRFYAEPGVVGRISDCTEGWCRFDAGGKAGHIRSETIYGLDRGETLD